MVACKFHHLLHGFFGSYPCICLQPLRRVLHNILVEEIIHHFGTSLFRYVVWKTIFRIVWSAYFWKFYDSNCKELKNLIKKSSKLDEEGFGHFVGDFSGN